MIRRIPILLLVATFTVPCSATHAKVDAPTAKAAVAKYVPVLERSLVAWSEKKTPCVSCHNQMLGAMVLSMAKQRALTIDPAAMRAAVFPLLNGPDPTELTLQGLGPASINPAFSGYIAMGISAVLGGALPDPSLMSAIARRQAEDGRWRSLFHRPPSEDSDFTATALSIRTLQLAQTPASQSEARVRIERARRWLETATPQNTEDNAFQVLGLRWAGAADEVIQRAATGLRDAQRKDGGWAQTATRQSDAYATGLGLVALQEGARVKAADPVVQKGLRYLLETQGPDGTWKVVTRHLPPSPGNIFYVDTFPHGEHQFISCAGSNWAAMALLHLLPEVTKHVSQPPPQPPPSKLPVWADTVLFGSVNDLRDLLNNGLDPNAKAPGGTTVLMMAVDSADKVRLLLDRAADVNAKAATGATALLVAAGLHWNTDVVRLLLDSGAAIDVSATGATVLGAAVTTDADKVALLLARGADPNRRLVHGGLGAFTPLQLAVSAGNQSIVRTLIANGANVNGHVNVWRGALPPLATAIDAGQKEMVELLVAAGGDVNQVDPLGMTPLLWAATADYGSADIVRLLLASGANPNGKDKSGASPVDLAKRNGFSYLARVLEAAQTAQAH
jgi:ankyrin repeat protein